MKFSTALMHNRTLVLKHFIDKLFYFQFIR